MNHYNLALLGFGNVGRALVRLLLRKEEELRDQYATAWKITGVASRRLGWRANPDGFDPHLLLDGNFQTEGVVAPSLADWLSAARADLLFENTSLNAENGEPAISHIRAALEGGLAVERPDRPVARLAAGDLVSVETTALTAMVDTASGLFRMTLGIGGNLAAF